ncbi:DUF3037 domain-containing protein [Reinekea marinisedimentorum]|uniref:DUF3037 family protein n=1 Tax=Reinekea marinisedimentorum TaxID=230495 RepID=A0A4R3HXI3_9GAMM|nr:DUF3037 domain-containing protein [Reinekea marinisedimentorum]TCS36139.1 Protein of unknown function (DUF3037) [Reinekea marinisedimentorum]
MKKRVIRYAVIRFQPYPETGEFANIGVIAIDPLAGQFQFKLEDRRSQRVTDFFHNLDGSFYRGTVRRIKHELEARRTAVANFNAKAIEVFEDLVMPKSNLFQFEQASALKATNLDIAIESLYGQFVGHKFAKKKSYEEQLRNKVKLQLDYLELKRPFGPYDLLGPGGIKTRFEFVQQGNNKPEKIIKPFGFNGADPSKLNDHTFIAYKYLSNARLAGINKQDLLIPVDVVIESEPMEEAWTFLRPNLEKFGELVKAKDTEKIDEFARQ